MKARVLFQKMIAHIEGTEKTFAAAGIKSKYDEMDYGFFPVGSGVFHKEKSKMDEADLPVGGVMILGNDFGTVSYRKSCKNNTEENGNTIRNLQKLELDNRKTFYTNFYLGLRDDETHVGTTNTKRKVVLSEDNEDYETLCRNFFYEQLTILKPKLVVCLGNAVRFAVADSFRDEAFLFWKKRSIPMQELYKNEVAVITIGKSAFGNITFIVIPHPCDRRNFTDSYIMKGNEILQQFG